MGAWPLLICAWIELRPWSVKSRGCGLVKHSFFFLSFDVSDSGVWSTSFEFQSCDVGFQSTRLEFQSTSFEVQCVRLRVPEFGFRVPEL